MGWPLPVKYAGAARVPPCHAWAWGSDYGAAAAQARMPGGDAEPPGQIDRSKHKNRYAHGGGHSREEKVAVLARLHKARY